VTIRLGDPLTFEDVVAVAVNGEPVELGPQVADGMAPARRLVEEVAARGEKVYGITTGIGDLANVQIDAAEAEQLQEDIVRSHATGVGPPLETEVVRAMLLLRARTFSFGISGVRYDIVDRLAAMLNEGVHPVVPSQGSLGASGDLAQLAHLALPLIGEGWAETDGVILDGSEAMARKGIAPLRLSFKEGLSLVNGTEMMLAIGILTLYRAEHLARAADVTSAMTLEACLGTDRAFDERIVGLRKHPGAATVASNLRNVLAGSGIVASHRHSEHLVQDAYSLRCVPQVHGAYRDGLRYIRTTLEAELGSAIDNPSVLADDGEVLSGGNFHGESLAIAMDHLALCLTGYATIAERRVARLVDPDLNNGLPAFLTDDPGRRSGFMLSQYTAAALVAENRTLCFPASSDSIPTSAGQEDHVSMGAAAARKARQVLQNSEHVIAIEALAAAQAIEMRSPLEPSTATRAAVECVRSVSPSLKEDRPLSADIATVARDLVEEERLVRAVEAAVGPLT